MALTYGTVQSANGGYTKVTTTVKAKDNVASQLDKAAAARGEAVAASALFGSSMFKKKGKKGAKKAADGAAATSQGPSQPPASASGSGAATQAPAGAASASTQQLPAAAQEPDDGLLAPDSVEYLSRRKVLEDKVLRASKKVAETEATLASIPAAPSEPGSADLV